MATAPTCMCALRSSSSRKSESREVRRSYQVSMRLPAYLSNAPVAEGARPMHVAAPYGFRTRPPPHDVDPEDPRGARAQPAAPLGGGGRRPPGVRRLDHRQRAGLERHGADVLDARPAEAARPRPVLSRRRRSEERRVEKM